jgi:hypothetical protein
MLRSRGQAIGRLARAETPKDVECGQGEPSRHICNKVLGASDVTHYLNQCVYVAIDQMFLSARSVFLRTLVPWLCGNDDDHEGWP